MTAHNMGTLKSQISVIGGDTYLILLKAFVVCAMCDCLLLCMLLCLVARMRNLSQILLQSIEF